MARLVSQGGGGGVIERIVLECTLHCASTVNIYILRIGSSSSLDWFYLVTSAYFSIFDHFIFVLSPSESAEIDGGTRLYRLRNPRGFPSSSRTLSQTQSTSISSTGEIYGMCVAHWKPNWQSQQLGFESRHLAKPGTENGTLGKREFKKRNGPPYPA